MLTDTQNMGFGKQMFEFFLVIYFHELKEGNMLSEKLKIGKKSMITT